MDCSCQSIRQDGEPPALTQFSCLPIASLGSSVGPLVHPRPLDHHSPLPSVTRDPAEQGGAWPSAVSAGLFALINHMAHFFSHVRIHSLLYNPHLCECLYVSITCVQVPGDIKLSKAHFLPKAGESHIHTTLKQCKTAALEFVLKVLRLSYSFPCRCADSFFLLWVCQRQK